MFQKLFFLTIFLLSSTLPTSSEEIVCPTQKQPGCSDILPATPMKCERNFCNVATSTSENGRTSCLWTCAAHFEGLKVNGVPVDSLFDALEKAQKR